MKTVIEKKPVMALNTGVMKINFDTSKFIAERVGKLKYGPHAGDGGNTFNFIMFNNEQRRKIAQQILERRSSVDTGS